MKYMAFDGFFIRKLVGEIEENILGAHINKINQGNQNTHRKTP